MNDTPQDPSSNPPAEDPKDESKTGESAPESTPDSTKKVETPPGMLPLVEPFFGNRAFLIAAVPFIIYFLGTALGGHWEMTRKTQPAHDIRGYSRSLLDDFRSGIKSNLLEEDAQAIIDKLELDSVSDALDDESSKVEVLVGKCQTLLDGGEFEAFPEAARQPLKKLRIFVEKFLQIQGLWEDGDLEEIRPTFIEFAEQHMPGKQLNLNKTWYPTLYTAACLLSFVGVIFAMPHYLRKMPFRISALAVSVGTIGVVLWIGIWWLNNEYGFGTAHSRAAFNPFEELKETPTWMWTFLGIRLLGMCLVIPIAEEFFTRGFLMRYCEDIDWDQIPIGRATWRGWAGILAYAAFSHTEIVAALIWFGMITWMYLKTKNIWDCVIAHAVTNGLLAAYVLATGTWVLW